MLVDERGHRIGPVDRPAEPQRLKGRLPRGEVIERTPRRRQSVSVEKAEHRPGFAHKVERPPFPEITSRPNATALRQEGRNVRRVKVREVDNVHTGRGAYPVRPGAPLLEGPRRGIVMGDGSPKQTQPTVTRWPGPDGDACKE